MLSFKLLPTSFITIILSHVLLTDIAYFYKKKKYNIFLVPTHNLNRTQTYSHIGGSISWTRKPSSTPEMRIILCPPDCVDKIVMTNCGNLPLNVK